MKGKNNGSNIEQQSQFDSAKWALIAVLVVAGLVLNFYYSQVPWAIRAAVGIVYLIALIGLTMLTAKGQQAWAFIKSARGELRKVVWPTRQETLQTTLLVVAMVFVTAIVLWGLDAFFFWAVSLVMGQRG